MSLLKMLTEAQNGQGLGQLAQQLGIDSRQAGGLAEMLAPALAKGTQRRVQKGGLEAILGQLQGEGRAEYIDNPTRAASPQGRAHGEQFLEQILGSREASNNLANEAANRTGISLESVSQFLPAIAAMLQGGMQRQMPDNHINDMLAANRSGGGGGIVEAIGGMLSGGGARGGQGGQGMDMLTQMLDADGDGSVVDDILEKVLGR